MKLLFLFLIGLGTVMGEDVFRDSSYQMHLCRHYETQFKRVAKEGSAFAKAGERAKAHDNKIKAVELMKALQKCDQSYLGINKEFLAETIKLAQEEIDAYEATLKP